jgi:hypothetical protein
MDGPGKSMKRADSLRRLADGSRTWLTKLPLLVCIGLFLFHFSVIAKYAVNIPNLDDWALIAGDNHPASFDLPWLYAQHNEHRTATTKLWVWLQFQINGWNVRTHQLLNFIWYGLFLALLIFCVRKLAPQIPIWVSLSFTVFLLSPIIWLEHFCAYTIAVHFWLIFFFGAAYLLFTESQRWLALITGSVAAVLSIFSFAAGVAACLILLVVFSTFKIVRAVKAKESGRGRELLQLLLVGAMIGSALGLWLQGFFHPSHHPPVVLPYHWSFWVFLCNLVSFSFGVEQVSTKIGLVFVLIVIVPVCAIIWRARARLTASQWTLVAIVFGLLGDLCAITCGRAGFGILASKMQEYAEHGMPLIILSVINWAVLLEDRRRLRIGALVLLWLLCFISFRGDWNFDIYPETAASRQEAIRCIKSYYEQTGDGICPTVYRTDISLAPVLEQAKRLNASVYRELHATLPPTASYYGVLSQAKCDRITGWAYDTSNPDAQLEVILYDGQSSVATARASTFLPGVRQAGYGTGRYGFEYPTPAALKDGLAHTIHVKFAGTARDLLYSPQKLICPKS